jgi:hypothetical protein
VAAPKSFERFLLVALVVLKKRVSPEALWDGGSAEREFRAYSVFIFEKTIGIFFDAARVFFE